MISTQLNELVHRYRSEGQVVETLLLDRSDFEKLEQELSEMHCRRALESLHQAHPSYYGLPLAIQENWTL